MPVMELIAIATTVCTLCTAIEAWIEQLAEKELLLHEVASSVTQIRKILSPFTLSESRYNGTGEVQLSEAIRSVGDILLRTKEHLIVWKSKQSSKFRSFINPNSIIQQLQKDQRLIEHQLIILLTSIAVVGYFRDHKSDLPTMAGSTLSTTRNFVAIDGLDDMDAREFWKDYIGAKVDFVTNDIFSVRLISWYQGNLSGPAIEKIIMRLDEYNSGGVTPDNLSRALGDTTLRKFVDWYARGKRPVLGPESGILVAGGHALKSPLLVWIDDRPENNVSEVAQAREMGIYVVELPSTAVAKAWIDANISFLCQNDDASHIRFITDNGRVEASTFNAPEVLNLTAGRNVLQYLRGRLLNAPVLVYTGGFIDSTRYVNDYEFAGSTTSARVCLRYISSLAAGMKDSSPWVGFRIQAGK